MTIKYKAIHKPKGCRVWLVVWAVVWVVFSNLIWSAIPVSEREALIVLYHSTHGDSWGNRSGWKTPPLFTDGFAMPGTEGSWSGVTVLADHVTQLNGMNNNLSGTIPPQLEQLGQLNNLELGGNKLSGSIPANLGNLGNLNRLSLSFNQLTGSIPAQLGNLSQLNFLNLCHNQLSGAIPASLGNLQNLEYLYLHVNRLSGAIPYQLGNLSRVLYFCLEENRLSGAIPAQLGNLSHVQVLYLQQNQLDGSIPSQLGNLGQLRLLQLQDNQLSGPIPAQLGNLAQLSTLRLYNNQLSGSIPSQLGNLSQLEYLQLNHNQLSGSIPPQLGLILKLHWLYLNNNQLVGHIPTELGNLSRLNSLYLNNNQLTGTIPIRFIYVPLSYLDIGYNCLTVTDPTLRTWLNTHDPDWEAQQNQCMETSTLHLNRSHLFFTAFLTGQVTGPQAVRLDNIGNGILSWSSSTMGSWFSSTPISGTGNGTITVAVNPTGLVAGTYYGTITIHAPNATNSPQTVTVTLQVKPLSEDMPPFGELATPGDQPTVSSSVPVTGWVLDDAGVSRVQIFREEGAALVYIGDATLVEGARPDVEAAFPHYPYNDKAGWGYMMLTYFLPHGDGPYKIHAVATDGNGNSTDLGTKTITVDNAHSQKPFGAIDTPAQGGTASGTYYVNFGWVLTPQPNTIPTDGSTIHVWIDGEDKGHPTYNNYREDIATLFPGYANSHGAVGYLYLDTTPYQNGTHTIQWTATDSAGNTDGIGSRYFTIQNSGASDLSSMNNGSAFFSNESFISNEELAQLPLNDTPVAVKKGYPNEAVWEESYPDANHIIHLQIKELEPIQIQFASHATQNISALPIGSTFDTSSGLFSWWPGPGFIGDYFFVFVEIDKNGQLLRKEIVITIVPKFQNNRKE